MSLIWNYRWADKLSHYSIHCVCDAVCPYINHLEQLKYSLRVNQYHRRVSLSGEYFPINSVTKATLFYYWCIHIGHYIKAYEHQWKTKTVNVKICFTPKKSIDVYAKQRYNFTVFFFLCESGSINCRTGEKRLFSIEPLNQIKRSIVL